MSSAHSSILSSVSTTLPPIERALPLNKNLPTKRNFDEQHKMRLRRLCYKIKQNVTLPLPLTATTNADNNAAIAEPTSPSD
jgi:hypothetical protein